MITSLLELFALGTVGFWALCVLISILFIATVENEKYWFPSLLGMSFIALYWKPLFNLVPNWHAIGIGALVYVLVGTVWSIFRWFRFVKGVADTYRENYADTVDGTINHLSPGKLADLKREIDVANNKSRITAWISFWPWSLVWNITGDFFKMVYEALSGVYENITKKALDGFTVEEKPKR